ncbi:putative transporter [Amylocarpus encephaloides]|uniref:Transporter n=1 Tax=Amylocarpus encephaloides TaxID=45428 RepID=A0A9P7YE47_9HELO|nr:putative transporter [Amylocarpus encephaloides]
MGAHRLLLYILSMSLGGAVIGIDLGIIATTLAQDSFNQYMFPEGTKNVSSLTGAIVSMGSAGNAIGCLVNGLLLERLGRRKTLAYSTFFTIVGSAFQTASNGVALMIIGRFVAGFALGILNPTIPIYISELAKPSERARLVGIFGMLVAIGFCLANWIGYVCSFAKGDTTWRLALGMQIPCAALLLGLAYFLPESPRWCNAVAQKERYEEFHSSLSRIYSDEADDYSVLRAQIEIREQIALEAEQRGNAKLGHALLEIFNKKNIRRTAMAIMVMQVGILSGSLAIQNYQSILYQSLGYKGRSVLLISGCYGFMGIAGQLLNNLFVSDKWSRVRTMWIGCLVLAVMLSVLMALSKFYGDGLHPAGSRAGIAFIFLFSMLYAVFFNSTLYTIAAETFPLHLRGYGTSIAALCQGVTGIWLGQVTPFAFAAIHWKYYTVFISCLLALAVLYGTCLTETNQLSLESIAGKFGDRTISSEKLDLAVKEGEKGPVQVVDHKEVAP